MNLVISKVGTYYFSLVEPIFCKINFESHKFGKVYFLIAKTISSGSKSEQFLKQNSITCTVDIYQDSRHLASLMQWYTKVYLFPSQLVQGRNQVYCACCSARMAHKPDITAQTKGAKSLLFYYILYCGVSVDYMHEYELLTYLVLCEHSFGARACKIDTMQILTHNFMR